ncbi:MAG: N-acetylmuramoyl-L-alanine amidase [Planctomycetes bacterium]|nr:N-acetylmuramoyl-L-alanine amidase [Planctomycetota bacterium]NUQ34059.1 N-acetylmuramoyl-L-alanine amidase [Planctomycetaceae bacterium]
MQRLVLMALASLLTMSCAAVGSDISVGHEPVMVTLSETAEKLGLKVEETDYWGERLLIVPGTNAHILVRYGCTCYWYNGLTRDVEYPGIKVDDRATFRFPLGMYNSICKDIGRIDLLRDEMPRYTRPAAVLNQPSIESIIPADDTPPAAPQATGSLKGMTIVVDPGHGGKDPGAIGITGVYEKVIAMAVSNRVADLLKQQGATIIMTRTDNDTYPTLSDRYELANTKHADLFISIHANSCEKPDINGVETYFHNAGARGDASERLARSVQSAMLTASGAEDRGVRSANFQVIKNTTMPAVLVELGYMSNMAEATKLAKKDYQETLAQAIVKGVLANQASNASLSR